MKQHPPERFAALSKALNEASDLLTSQIVSVESALNELRLGIEAWIEVSRSKEVLVSDTKTENAFTRLLYLGYAKHAGHWRLVVEERYEEIDLDDMRDVVALQDAKRDVRLEVADKIPILVEKIQLDAVQAVREIDEKAQRLKEFAASLRKSTR